LSLTRWLLKLSGEALAGTAGFGFDADAISRISAEVAAAHGEGGRFAIVVGGGNLLRGAQFARSGANRVTADHMGMLATAMNALAVRDGLRGCGLDAVALGAQPVAGVLAGYASDEARAMLEVGRVVVLAGGTGNPLFTTDTTACLRAVELGATAVIKATKVDGVYSADPLLDPTARRFEALGYEEVISRTLAVMDMTAILLARDHALPIVVCDMNESGALTRLIRGEKVGTRISGQLER
jgi:uridylate kinase